MPAPPRSTCQPAPGSRPSCRNGIKLNCGAGWEIADDYAQSCRSRQGIAFLVGSVMPSRDRSANGATTMGMNRLLAMRRFAGPQILLRECCMD